MKQRLFPAASRWLAVPLAYLLLTLLLWWPLPLHLTTHVPGSDTWAFDEYTFVWNPWWFRTSLLDLGVSPLHSDYLFAPLGIDLVLYTYNLLNSALSLPLLDWLGPVLSSNLMLIFMSVLSGWGTWLLVRWLLWRTLGERGAAARLAAFGAGALYAFGAYRAIYAALGHYDLVSTGFIPFFALFFLKAFWGRGRENQKAKGKRQKLKITEHGTEKETESTDSVVRTTDYGLRTTDYGLWTTVLAGLFLAAALYNEMIFGVFLAMLGLLLMALTWRRRGAGWLPRLAAMAVAAALLWAPAGVPVVRTLLSTDFVLTGWGDAMKLSADLLSFTSPTALHPLGPDWVEELRAVKVNAVAPGTSRFNDVNTVFVGVSTLLLAALGWWRFRAQARAWGWGLVAFMVLALGPLLQVAGRYQWSFDNVLGNGELVEVPLPFLLLHYIPIVQGNRAANRFSVVLMLCAAVLVGYGLFAIAKWVVERWSMDASRGEWRQGNIAARTRSRNALILYVPFSILIALLLAEQLAAPLPLTDARIPAGYAALEGEPDGTLLTLPLGWRNSFGVTGAENTRNEYYMTAHRRRLVQGNISRAPAEKFEYWQRLPVLRSLITIQNDGEISPEQRADDAARAAEVMALLGVRHLAVHPAVPGRPPYEQNRERALAYLQEVLPLEPLYEGDDLLLYRVAAPAPPSGTLDIGAPESEIYQLSGFGGGEHEGERRFAWVTGQEARLLLPLDDAGQSLDLAITLRPFQRPQTVTLLAEGRPVGEPVALEEGWQTVRFSVPPAQLDGFTARLALRFDRADQPVALDPSSARLGTTGTTLRAAITVKSAAAGLSDLDSSGLAWITVNGEDASEHRTGTNVTVLDAETGAVEAVRGFDTSANEFERDALHAFISEVEAGKVVIVALRGPATSWLNLDTVAAFQTLGAATGPTDHNVSYALIGVKGAPPGSALEAQSTDSAVDLVHLPDDRTLSSAIDTIEWR